MTHALPFANMPLIPVHRPIVELVSAVIVADVMTTLIEGGESEWFIKATLTSPDQRDPETRRECPWYSDPNLYGENFQFLIYGGTSEETSCSELVTIDKISQALSKMATDYPCHFTDLATENHDAITADIFGQLLIYGEVIYG